MQWYCSICGSPTQIFPTISQKLYFWAPRSQPIFPCEIINLYTLSNTVLNLVLVFTQQKATAKGQKGANYGLKRGKRNSFFRLLLLSSLDFAEVVIDI